MTEGLGPTHAVKHAGVMPRAWDWKDYGPPGLGGIRRRRRGTGGGVVSFFSPRGTGSVGLGEPGEPSKERERERWTISSNRHDLGGAIAWDRLDWLLPREA